LDVSSVTLEDGAAFEMKATGLKFIEVTIDFDTFVSTPVTGGETWCVDDWTVSNTFIDLEEG